MIRETLEPLVKMPEKFTEVIGNWVSLIRMQILFNITINFGKWLALPVTSVSKANTNAGHQWISLIGQQGETGVRGEKGEQGITGATGVQGATGERGEQGITGATGLQGATGERGAQGVTGATGLQGEQGVTGATGLQGATGEKGDRGERGVTGATGVKGATGEKGEKGETGKTGATGAAAREIYRGQWLAGEIYLESDVTKHNDQFWQLKCSITGVCQQGEPGTVAGHQWISLMGEKGDTGSQGIQGEKGETGSTGAQGHTGSTGATGAAGRSVMQGTFNLNVDYHNGDLVLYEQKLYYMVCPSVYTICPSSSQGVPTSLSSGWVEARGTQGIQGEAGVKGATGATGIGLTGATGAAGATGATGSQGRSSFQGLWMFGVSYKDGDIVKHNGETYQFVCATSGACVPAEPPLGSWISLRGATGLQGATGERGEQGITGATGARGATGLQGATGERGEQGIQGEKGATGAQGSTMYVGIWSALASYKDGDIVKYGSSNNLRMYQLICPLMGSCIPGIPGEDTLWFALQGERGIQGEQGITGNQGIQGEKGATGAAARQVFQGGWHEDRVESPPYIEGDIVKWNNVLWAMVCSANSPCVNGVPGESGNDWQMLQGSKGEMGSTGAQGIQGIQGEQGATGAAGSQGRSSFQGSYQAQLTYMEGDIVEWKQDMWILRCVDGLACDQSTAPDIAGNDWHNLRGNQGNEGARGATGVTGATGAQGLAGQKGDAGRSSYQGQWIENKEFLDADIVKWQSKMWQLVCPLGAVCRYGEPGTANTDWVLMNIVGATGIQGATGATGAKGDKGDVGATGAKGDKGDNAEHIYRGQWIETTTYNDGDIAKHNDKMWQLICSVTCVQGVPGFLGTDWEPMKGESGVKGETGAKGDKGDKGDSGATGATGESVFKGQWLETVVYKDGDMVKHNSNIWHFVCVVEDACQQGVPEFLNTDWQKLQGEVGLQGATGATGEKGDKGDVGATGAAKVLFRGQWSDQNTYEEADIVKYDEKLFQLLCPTGFTCSTAAPTALTSDWHELMLRGEQGIQGVQGETGAQGVQGTIGEQGIQGIGCTRRKR